MEQTSVTEIAKPSRLGWLKKKWKWIVFIVIVLFVGFILFKPKDLSYKVQTDTVKRQSLRQTVLSTGQVVSGIDLNLSFQGSGVVRRVHVKEGDRVKSGQVLAVLDQASARASYTSALGSLAQARANYDRIVSGSTDQQIGVSRAAVTTAQVTLDNAKRTYDQIEAEQELAVTTAYRTLLNTGLAAIPGPSNVSGASSPTISGAYTSAEGGAYKISFYTSGSGLRYLVSGMETGEGSLNQGIPVALGTRGLYMTFPTSGTYVGTDVWTVDIPNTRATSYVTYLNAYQAAKQAKTQALTAAQNTVESAQAALSQAKAALDQTIALATSAEIRAANAQILSAQGQVQSAQATLNNTVLLAPADGTITRVDVKVGELAAASQTVMVLQNIEDLHAEAHVSEANVASIREGQLVEYTFDAFGPDRVFHGTVQRIDPASTVVSGVVNYKVMASLDQIPDLKPGMTANMTILVTERDQTLAVPSRAIINRNGQTFVRVIDDPKKKTYHEVEVTTGLRADGGWVEVNTGVSEGQEIVTFIQP